MSISSNMHSSETEEIAQRFVDARQTAILLDAYPGPIPENLTDAYQIQDIAIGLWPDCIAGWKVGQIRPDHRERFGHDRILGPIFSKHIQRTASSPVPDMPLFDRGFSVIEAEYIAVVGEEVPADKFEWSIDESMSIIEDLCVGIETAGSPLPALNTFGAAAVVSDFGVHGGLVVGPSISGWRERDLDNLECETLINDKIVGRGGTRNLSGGIARSVQATLESITRRGHELTAGDLISTGATTGVHVAVPSDEIRVSFGVDGVVECSIITATVETNT